MPKAFLSRHSDLSRCRIPVSERLETSPAAGALLRVGFLCPVVCDFFLGLRRPHMGLEINDLGIWLEPGW
jgi:hypothetical protein